MATRGARVHSCARGISLGTHARTRGARARTAGARGGLARAPRNPPLGRPQLPEPVFKHGCYSTLSPINGSLMN